MITKSDILPCLVAIVGLTNVVSPDGMLHQWQKSLQSSLQDQQFQVGSFTVSIPPNWDYQEDTVYLPDGTSCEIKQSARSTDTLDRLVNLLEKKYPGLKVVDNNSQKVIVLNQEKTIVAYENSEQYMLVTVPLQRVSDLLRGFSVKP